MKTLKKDMYKCPGCDEFWDQQANAIKCCADDFVSSTWRCTGCETEYGSEEDALSCCGAEEVIVYECSACGERYDDQYQADHCCEGGKTETGTGWVCDECDKQYQVRMLAVLCCTSIERKKVFFCGKCDGGYDSSMGAESCCR